ncbi:MAG: outer membrane protein assembly factor [Desulfovibrionaceae bacterium]|nr:outer membrane protein assembly factor [Desulfovibrionaceae bacterium]
MLRFLAAGLVLCVGLLPGCSLFRGEPRKPDTNPAPALQGDPVPYVTVIRAEEPVPGFDDARTPSEDDMRESMSKSSQLVQLEKQPPDSLLGLERRARQDREAAVTLLHSLGYYEGEASFSVDSSTRPVTVTLTLSPGHRYMVGRVSILYSPEPVVPPAFLNRTRETGLLFKHDEALPDPVFPHTLDTISPGDPAVAAPILDAVEALPRILRNEGYPFARVASARYSLDRQERRVHADIVINPGPAAVMDGIRVSGAPHVHDGYLRRLIPWRRGQPWDDRQLSRYRETLQQLGLFNTVDVRTAKPQSAVPLALSENAASRSLPEPQLPFSSGAAPPDAGNGLRSAPLDRAGTDFAGHAPKAASGEAAAGDLPEFPADRQPVTLPVDVALREAAFRTVGAGMRYSTDVGFGVQGAWEHRNLFGNGESLKIKVPVAQDLQGLQADFVKPSFGRPNQTLLAGGAVEREKTDAYTKRAVSAYSGLNRRLSAFWWADARVDVEEGTLEANRETTDYRFLSLSLGLRRDTRNNTLNPSSGTRLSLTVTPISGLYHGAFSALATTMDASAYYAPGESDSLVLAGRLALGSMAGSSLHSVPATLRYYAGGGGSVRGYAYQALGARDNNGEPLGGRSFQELNLEARFKITDSIGVVPFVDAGMVYESEFPRWARDLDWALGMGLRYFTPIGPVRFDVAFPLTRIRGEQGFQLYISIGQAF